MRNFDHFFRTALLLLLAAGMVVAIWHLAWMHREPENRYEALAAGAGLRAIFVLDRQQGTVYAGEVGEGGEAIRWHPNPLPKP